MDKLDKFILGYAHWIDNLDMYIGPFSDAGQLANNPLINEVATYFDVFQIGVLKLPFVALYLAKTRDFSAIFNWLPREMMALSLPYGGLIEVMRNYEKTTKEYYEIKRV